MRERRRGQEARALHEQAAAAATGAAAPAVFGPRGGTRRREDEPPYGVLRHPALSRLSGAGTSGAAPRAGRGRGLTPSGGVACAVCGRGARWWAGRGVASGGWGRRCARVAKCSDTDFPGDAFDWFPGGRGAGGPSFGPCIGRCWSSSLSITCMGMGTNCWPPWKGEEKGALWLGCGI